MLTYKYTARDPGSGQKITAVVQADSEQAAAKLIRAEGFAPIEIAIINERKFNFFGLVNRIKSKDKILFARQLATLINAGLPLVQSLHSVSKQTTNKEFKVIINQIIADVEGGSAFSASLSKYPKVFSRVFISLIAAGEVSGTLDAALERIATQQEKDAEIVSKVRGAMVYPIIVLIVMFGVLAFMLIKVLPQVEVLYTSFQGASLPLITRLLLDVSHFAVERWWVVVGAITILIILLRRWIITEGGREVFDSLKMKAWPAGPLFMKLYMARFSRTGTTLVASGVPIIQVLEITGDAINNVHIERSLKAAIEKVKGGKSLSDALRGDDNFLELVPNMLQIGEQSGTIEQMMQKVAEYYEKEVDNEVKTISTIIEPVMMVILGVLALIIVVAILLPVYGLAGQGVVR